MQTPVGRRWFTGTTPFGKGAESMADTPSPVWRAWVPVVEIEGCLSFADPEGRDLRSAHRRKDLTEPSRSSVATPHVAEMHTADTEDHKAHLGQSAGFQLTASLPGE
ncbi:MAG: hypothetical protein D6760_03910 [Deltaproteobacteria bacterium]|nr:MAG: hypothetical protein D6760_03910 [Deltaproteobacteria bacterium]